MEYFISTVVYTQRVTNVYEHSSHIPHSPAITAGRVERDTEKGAQKLHSHLMTMRTKAPTSVKFYVPQYLNPVGQTVYEIVG
jgi:uncharacterized protein (DUF849 family)